MVGQWTATKPSRSDDLLDEDEQRRIANQVRAQFDTMAPKRPTKPNRSESDFTTPTTPDSDENIPIPEFEKFRSLQTQSEICHPLPAIIQSANRGQEEFVETQYYQQLNSVDKQHHTTGSGFIKVVSEGQGNGIDLKLQNLQNGHENGDRPREMTCRSNPATNDWIPSFEDDDHGMFVSAKPNRSESG